MPEPIRWSDLPGHERARRFEGADHGAEVSSFVSRNPPGTGATLHKHPYEEVFIMLEGEATFTVGGTEIAAGSDDVLIVPPNTPHGFTNSGQGQLRQVNIHVSPSFRTDWL